MVSIGARIVRLYLSYFGSHAMFLSAEKSLAAMECEYIRPPKSPNPPKMPDTIIVTRVDKFSMPLYLVSPAKKGESGNDTDTEEIRVMYIHGGSFFREIQPAHWTLIQKLVLATKCSVLVPIYPLLPRPTATAHQVAQELSGYIDDFGITCIMGDSAGGTIAASLMHLYLSQSKTDSNTTRSRIKSVVLIAPVLDLDMSHPTVHTAALNDPWLAVPGLKAVCRRWAGDATLTDPIVSPLFADFAKFPEMLVMYGTHDLLVADGRRLKNKYLGLDDEVLHDTSRQDKSSGSVQVGGLTYVEVEEMLHVYPLLPCNEGNAGVEQICDFVKLHI